MWHSRPEPPAPDRQPACPHFFECGGCDLQDRSYAAQTAWKAASLETLFAPLLKDEGEVLPFVGSPSDYPLYYRNKIRFGFTSQDGRIFPSRHRKGSDANDLPVTTCLLQSEESMAAIRETARLAEELGWEPYSPQTGKGWLKHLLIRQGKRDGGMLISLVSSDPSFPGEDKWIERMRSLPFVSGLFQTVTAGRNNFDAYDRYLWGERYAYERVGDFRFRISLHAFFQTNSLAVESLYQAVGQTVLPEGKNVWDLYAGSATIGIYLSPAASSVLSIESNPENIADGEWNKLENQAHTVELVSGTVEEVLDSRFLKSRPLPDAIVLDPPRAGLSDRIKRLLPYLGAKEVTYVSCNPYSCLRDCQELVRSGFRLATMQGIDMFPQTLHCETIVKLVL